MAMNNLAAQVVAAWEHATRISPDPLRGSLLAELLGVIPRRTYRERLDERPINMYDEVIPRIAIVQRNLLRLGRLKSRPDLPQ